MPPPPVLEVGVADFAATLRLTRFDCRFVLPLSLDTGPGLPARVRGAWGHALKRRADMGDAEAAAALAVLFGMGNNGQKPFHIEADDEGAELAIGLTLIGMADRWRDVAFESFAAALCDPPGLAHGAGANAKRKPLRMIGAAWRRTDGSLLMQPDQPLRLNFLTPFRTGPADRMIVDHSYLLVAAAQRSIAMARWSGLSLIAGLGEVRDLGRAIQYDDSGLRPVAWSRNSSRQGGCAKAMNGFAGHLLLLRYPEQVTTLLQLAEALHVGAQTSLGLGRFKFF